VRLSPPSPGLATWMVIEMEVTRILSARLDPNSTGPIAVALSGGGDSVALLLAARWWARDAGRALICLTVDHGLSPDSGTWTAACADRARRLGLAHRALSWTGAKPSTGLAAAARAARHRLLADAARQAGASVILVGHTADDRLEARAMRAEGCSVSEPRPWSPSPAWPEGRGVFLLRPLIDIRRAAIRRGLAERGETWLDDPANVDEESFRARARRQIAGGGEASPALDAADASALFRAATVGWAGDIGLELALLRAASPASRRRFLSAALVCAAGGAAPPRSVALDRLWERMTAGTRVAATLAGARLESDGHTVRIVRDDGALPASPWAGGVFDGRYAIEGEGAGESGGAVEVFALGGHMARLDRRERDALKSLSPAARRALPATRREDGSVTCPLLDGRGRSLVANRLAAACGAVAGEAAIRRVGEIARGVLDMPASRERSVHEPA
jgi:tRNA(Ile)-lysidine synthase